MSSGLVSEEVDISEEETEVREELEAPVDQLNEIMKTVSPPQSTEPSTSFDFPIETRTVIPATPPKIVSTRSN